MATPSVDVAALLFGEGPYAREGAPEPALLPHLARLLGDDERDRLWFAAEHFGLSGSVAPPWPPLWEAVVAAAPPPGGSDRPWPSFELSVAATELPTLPETERRARADQLADELQGFDGPWFVALAVSRIAPFASPGRSWPVTGDDAWDELIARLASAGWPAEPFGDVLRAHPFAAELALLHGRHEAAAAALDAMLHRWGALAQAAPPEAGAEPPPDVGAEPVPRSAQPIPPPPPAAPAPPARRRLQADVATGGRELTHAFVAGSLHHVDVSVGRQAAIAAGADFPVVAMPEDVDRVRLTVRFVANGAVQEGAITLPRDETRESTTAAFELAVPADARQVSALVVVYHGTEVLQGAVLSGPVVADVDAEKGFAGAITLDVGAFVKDLVPPSASSATASVVADATTAVAASPAGTVAVDISALRDEVAGLAERIDSGAELLFQGDEQEVERLFRDLALHGRRLRAVVAEQLGPELSAASQLQVVTLSAGAFLPLELVYDGPQPATTSTLCPDWRAAARAGSCGACAPAAGDAAPSVCPSHFWGLAKVIERHAGLGGRAGAFEVRSERSDGASALPPLVGAVVGASGKVEAADVSAVVAVAEKTFRQARQAGTWAEWVTVVGEAEPAVLVALPHHEEDSSVDPALSALELGSSLLHAGGIELQYVGDGRPGPVVVLLGCNTMLDRTPIDSFAGEFRAAGASVVVATLGPVIPGDAARAAETLLGAMGEAAGAAGEGATFGEVMLHVRRALVAEGLVLGLLLVANGDADWRVAR